MWIVQVIEVGTGKLLEENWSRDREKMEIFSKEMEIKFPNENVCLDYMS
jgi:hypothetical protein